MMRASSAPFGRGGKNQKFSLPFFFSSAGGVGGADKKWKGNFWFCFAVSDYKMNICIIAFVVLWSCSFLRPHGETRRFLSAFCGGLKLCASVTGRGNSKNMDCAWHKQICMYLTHPPCARTNPRHFEETL